ncbi:hypothetical protein G6F59_018110 [Rhizopus arrhizus]|nr:hypothetical protein G6F24_017340 [Rhizopus arrhizus]KAG0923963.1 hypothetical protein G6F32_014079 [Rhizopus arrhizus]KAG1378476.1 hypothetical protein G6F59_018110 [Rhizopus arrhizus]
MGAGHGTLAAPAIGLDAEQVVRSAAVGMLDVTLAPAGFQRCLGDQRAGIHAELLGCALRVLPDAGNEALRGMLAELGHGGAGGQGIGRTDRGAAIAGGRRPLVAASRPVIALQAADVGIVGAE